MQHEKILQSTRLISPQFRSKFLSLCWSSDEMFHFLTSLSSFCCPPSLLLYLLFITSHPPTNPGVHPRFPAAASSSSTRASPHPNMPGHDGCVGAVGLHRHYCQRGGHEVHQGGRQQPGHQDSHCRDGRSSLPARGYVMCRLGRLPIRCKWKLNLN